MRTPFSLRIKYHTPQSCKVDHKKTIISVNAFMLKIHSFQYRGSFIEIAIEEKLQLYLFKLFIKITVVYLKSANK